MLGPRTVLIELRNGVAGIEGRVRRGEDGEWSSVPILDWTRLGFDAIEPLRQECESARIDPHSELWGSAKAGGILFPFLGAVGTTLCHLHQLGDVDRVVLAEAAPAPGSREGSPPQVADLTPVLWRALCWNDGDNVIAPFVQGAWQLVHCDDPTPLARSTPTEIDALHLFVVITSLEDPGGDADLAAQRRRAATDLIEHLRRTFDDYRGGVALHIAASTCYPELGDRDLRFGSRAALETLLKRGTLVDGAPPVPIDALVLFGHSDMQVGKDAFAAGLQFAVPGEPAGPAETEVLGAERLAALLGRSTPGSPAASGLRILFAANCGSAGLAPWLTGLADHLITTSTAIEAADTTGVVAGLFHRLAEAGGTVGTALAAAIRDVASDWRLRVAALIEHRSRRLDDTPFLVRAERELAAYYLRHIEDHAELQANFGQQAKAELRQIHVPLDIRQSTQEAARPGADTPDPDLLPGHRARRDHFTFTALIAERPGRVVLRGEAGGGKTTTLRVFTLDRPTPWLPIYLSLTVFLRDHPTLPDRSADGILGAISHSHGLPALADALRARPRDVVFLLDGFDEIDTPDRRATAIDLAKLLVEHLPGARVVISARETADLSALEDSGWQRATLRRLDTDQQEQLLDNWFESAAEPPAVSAADWVRALHASSRRVAELCGNPLMLTYISDLILAGKQPEDFERGLHEVVSDFIDLAVSRAYRRGDGAAECPFDRDDLREVLRWISWRMIEARQRAVDSDGDLRKWLRSLRDGDPLHPAVQSMLRECGGKFDRLVKAIGDHSGVFRPEWGKGSAWKFTHNILQEALAAEHWWHVVLRAGTDTTPVLAHLRAQLASGERDAALDFWTEPTVFLASLMRSGRIDAFAAELVADNDTVDLARRVLLQTDRADPHHIVTVASRIDDEDDRTALYAQVPALVRDQERAAACLIAIGQAHPRPHDLYFLGETLRSLSPAHAEARLEALYAAAPEPDIDVLTWMTDTWWCRRNDATEEHLWKPIPAGSFGMGDDEEIAVEITRPFWVCAVPVTLGMFRSFAPHHEQRFDASPHHPAHNLNWFEANAFCAWLNARALSAVRRGRFDGASRDGVPPPSVLVERGWRFRLLSEAEWEYVCRAGTTTPFWSGDALEVDGEAVARYGQGSGGGPDATGQRRPNPWELYDVHGQVWEWCLDWYAEDCAGGRDPAAQERGSGRVLRGGSFWNVAENCRSACVRVHPAHRDNFFDGSFGFRVAFAAPLPSSDSGFEFR